MVLLDIPTNRGRQFHKVQMGDNKDEEYFRFEINLHLNK